MAQINIEDDQNLVIQEESIQDSQSIQEDSGNGQIQEGNSHSEDELQKPSDKIVGLTSEEYNDPNKISVTIADKDAPIVVLFGPPACGKTMTLVRMTRYLRDNGYTITPIRTFRPTQDNNYSDICDNFDMMMNQEDAAKSTSKISFMLVKVIKNGRTICQILEAPGEYYFNPKAPQSPFPKYFNAIKSSRNRKIWAIMVEPDWENESDRLNYVDRIRLLRKQMKVQDSTIIVYNKIDKTDYLIDSSGNAHMALARKNVRDLYPNIFDPFKNTTPIVSWFVPYKFDFAIFQTGDYSTASDGSSLFEQGPDVFPRRLWKIIMDKVRG